MLKRLFSLFRKPATTVSQDTEFMCEVVQITAVTKHANADRLELARFKTLSTGKEQGYEVVTQAGSYKPGDLATYLSVDCVVPLSNPLFAFLGSPDTKRTTHRIKAARLRGVFSQGLLVPAQGAYGEQVAAKLGVSYHSPPTLDGPTATTHQAKAQPSPIYGVTSLKREPDLFSENDMVLITEKIHGTNFRFGWIRRKVLGIPFGWRFFVGSHRVEKGIGNKGYYGEDLWAEFADVEALKERTAIAKGKVFYGEIYGRTLSGKRIQDLDYGCLKPRMAIFDVLDSRTGEWYSPMDREQICNVLRFPVVPLLYVGQFDPDDTKAMAEGVSTLDPGTVREGVVVESLYGARRKAKYVGQGYLLRKSA